MICERPRFHRACILLRFLLPIGAAKRGFTEYALSLSTAFATFKVILGFITMGILLARPFFFSLSWLTTTPSVKSTVFGATVGWQRAK